MAFLAKRLNRIQPSPTLAITAKAAELKAQGHDIINLGVGEPDFDTPDPIKKAASEAIVKGLTKYTAVDGLPDLKKAIQAKFQRDNHLSYELNQITVANGAKQIIFNALMATVEEGDEVIIPAPYWVSYPDIVQLCGGKPIIVPCAEDHHFKLTPVHLKAAITPRTKWLILNSPSNPTGSVYSALELKALGQVLLDYPQVHVISDDIYEHLIYDQVPFATLAAVDPELFSRILTVNGVSKSHSMTGWRIGYAGGPKPLIQAMSMLQSQSTSNACSISQAAAIEALNGDQSFLLKWQETFRERRNRTHKQLQQIPGLSCRMPEGAFYLYVNCMGLLGKETEDGMVLANDTDVSTYLLSKAGVAVVNGAAFGLSPYIRLSYATSQENLDKACERINRAVLALKS